MQSTKRFALLALLACLCAPPEPSHAVPFDLFGAVDGQGVDPLVDPYPFFVVFAGGTESTRTALIIFQSDDYAGVITLRVDCCLDDAGNSVQIPGGVDLEAVSRLQPLPHSVRTPHPFSLQVVGPAPPGSPPPALGSNTSVSRLQVGPAPGSPPPAPPGLRSNQFVTGAHEVHMVGLKVTSRSNTRQFFVATVTAAKSDGTARSTQVKISLLPDLMDDGFIGAPYCAAYASTLTGTSDVPVGTAGVGDSLISAQALGGLAKSLFDQKVATPQQIVWPIAYAGDATSAGAQTITLSKSGLSLTPNQAKFVFYNPTSVRYDKQYVVFNSEYCSPTATFLLKPGERASFVASRADTTTILLRGSERKGWRSNAVFSERVFWTLFGGKEVDFEWEERY